MSDKFSIYHKNKSCKIPQEKKSSIDKSTWEKS
jgi:hypothetical protein